MMNIFSTEIFFQAKRIIQHRAFNKPAAVIHRIKQNSGDFISSDFFISMFIISLFLQGFLVDNPRQLIVKDSGCEFADKCRKCQKWISF